LPTGIPEHPNAYCDKLFNIIKILGIMQICLGILNIFVDIWSGIIMLMGALLLFMIVWTMNWCTCIFYIVLCIMDLITSVMFTGDYLADEKEVDDTYGVLVIIMLIKVPFYIVSIYYVFLAYRELKGLFIEAIERGPMVPSGYGYGYGAAYGAGSSNPPPPPPEQPRQQPFTGPGYRLG